MAYIKLHTEVVDGVRKISSFDTNGNAVEQYDLGIILHALSAPEPTQGSKDFAYDFGMDF